MKCPDKYDANGNRKKDKKPKRKDNRSPAEEDQRAKEYGVEDW